MENKKLFTPKASNEAKELPAYEVPRVISYTDEEILDVLGPAQASSSGGR